MEFNIAAVFNRSVTIELINDSPYMLSDNVEVYIDDELKLLSDKNVITVSNLLPSKDYTIGVKYRGENLKKRFRTKFERVLLNVKNFGAKGDGRSLDTAAIQAAISACPLESTVYIPEGIYLITPVFLKSDITLWLDDKAVLIGDINRSSYPILPGMIQDTDEMGEYNLASWEGNPLDSFASLITGINVSNVDIIGGGTIDGRAQESDWWHDAKKKRVAWRPNLIFLCKCNNIRIQGINMKNSPSWTLHPYYSDNLEFLSINIFNPPDSPNTDGFDPESCENVKLLGAVISVGDDCVAIKSGKYYMSKYHYKPTKNILIRNCRFERGHGSVTVGSEVASGVSNVSVLGCVFESTDRGLRIKTRRGRGELSVLDNIKFENIIMENVNMPFTVNMFYFCDPDGHSDYVQTQSALPIDDKTPKIGKIRVKDIVANNTGACLACFYGLPERCIGEIELINIKAKFRDIKTIEPTVPIMMDDFPHMQAKGIFAKNIESLRLGNIHIENSADSEPELINIGELFTERVIYENS